MSAHGTNPASAQMCAMQVVVVKCDTEGECGPSRPGEQGGAACDKFGGDHGDLSPVPTVCLRLRYAQVCDIVHRHGGQVYIDGANLNAMVGICEPGKFGGDVSHLNLHKTFCIPAWRWRARRRSCSGWRTFGCIFSQDMPVSTKPRPLAPFSAAAWGSAGILPISWMYIKMMGASGLLNATCVGDF